MKFEDLETARQAYINRFRKVFLISFSVAALPALLFMAPMIRGGLVIFSLLFFFIFVGCIALVFTIRRKTSRSHTRTIRWQWSGSAKRQQKDMAAHARLWQMPATVEKEPSRIGKWRPCGIAVRSIPKVYGQTVQKRRCINS